MVPEAFPRGPACNDLRCPLPASARDGDVEYRELWAGLRRGMPDMYSPPPGKGAARASEIRRPPDFIVSPERKKMPGIIGGTVSSKVCTVRVAIRSVLALGPLMPGLTMLGFNTAPSR